MNQRPEPFNLLIVEDSPGDLELLRYLLRETSAPMTLHAVGDGATALEFLLQQGRFHANRMVPDLVLLDLNLNLPGNEARRLLQAMKSHPALSTIPVVVLSTADRENEVAEFYRLGAAAYVVKPLELEDFRAAIDCLVAFYFVVVRLPQRRPSLR